MCRKVRSFDPRVDSEDSQFPRRSWRGQDPSVPAHMLLRPHFQPNPQAHNSQYHQYRQYLASLTAPAEATSSRANGHDMAAEPPQFLPLADAMQPQQPASNVSSSHWGMPAASPTTATPGSRVIHQQPSHSVFPAHSPITLQSNEFPQQVRPDDLLDPNLPPPSEKLGTANLQPPYPTLNPYQHVMNGNHGQEHPNVLTMAQSPIYPGDLALLAQPLQYEQSEYKYPEPGDAAGPSAESNAMTSPPNCQCGPGCNCVYCVIHPYNSATRERVQDLTRFMTTDAYWSHNSVSRPHSGYGGASTNDTSMESVMGQGYSPPGNEPFPSPASGWTNATVQSPVPQSTSNQDPFVNNGDHSNQFSSRPMLSSGYYVVPYPANSHCTNTTGTCLCHRECRCLGCLSHEGHNADVNY